MPHASLGLLKSSHSQMAMRRRLPWIEFLIAILFFLSLWIGLGGTPTSIHSSKHKANVQKSAKSVNNVESPKTSQVSKRSVDPESAS